MDELKTVLGTLGFEGVRTVIASGNVIFSGEKSSVQKLESTIASALHKKFGFEIGVIVRPLSYIESMVEADPFKRTHATPNTRLYVTFLSEKLKSKVVPKSAGGFKIVKTTEGEVYGVVTLSKDTGTIDAMSVLTKMYGKKITTRNWNTIVKIVSAH